MAEFHVLADGYARDEGDDSRVGSTVSLIRDGDAIVIVDPGLVSSRSAILDPLAALDVRPEDVTDVVISHHHPDHTLNVALFPHARLHDHWAIYRDDLWMSRDAEGFAVSPGVTLMETPGHTAAGHQHGGADRSRGRRLHASLVDGGRPGRGPVRARPEAAARAARAGARPQRRR